MKRVLVTATIPFLVAVGIAHALFLESAVAPWVCMGILLVASIFVALVPMKNTKLGEKNITQVIMIIALLFAALGFARVGAHVASLPDDILLEGKEGIVRGTIKSISKTSAQTSAYRVKLTESEIEGLNPDCEVIIYAPYREELRAGDRIMIEGECQRFTSTPTMDFERYYRERGVDLIMRSKHLPELYGRAVFSLYGAVGDMTTALLEKVDTYTEEPYSSMLSAMLLGDDAGFDTVIYQAITRAGVNHIFIVSGLHITVLSGFIMVLVQLFNTSRRVRAIIVLTCTWLFVAITGFGLSAMRAGITMSVLLIGEFFHRQSDPLNSLCGAAFVLVLINPSSLTQTGFLLTFSATSGMVLLHRPIAHRLLKRVKTKNILVRYVLESFASTLAVTAAMMPVILPLFGGISILSPILNLLLVPLLPVILISGMLLIVVPFDMVALSIGKFIEAIFAFVAKQCAAIAELPFCYLGFDEIYWRVGFWAVLLLSLLMLLLYPAVTIVGKNGSIRQSRPQFRTTLSVGLAMCVLLGVCVQFQENSRLHITTFGGNGGATCVIRVGRNTAVTALADDGRIDREVMTFLQGKNHNNIEWYVALGDAPRLMEDTIALSKQARIDTIMAPEVDRARLVERLTPLRFMSLENGKGYSLPLGDEFDVKVENSGSMGAVWVRAGEIDICITSSPTVAKESKCEILIYGGDFSEIYEQITPKYVILLKEPSEEIEAKGIWHGYRSQYELVLKPDGTMLKW